MQKRVEVAVTYELGQGVENVAAVARVLIEYEGEFTPEESAAVSAEFDKWAQDPEYSPRFPERVHVSARSGKIVFSTLRRP